MISGRQAPSPALRGAMRPWLLLRIRPTAIRHLLRKRRRIEPFTLGTSTSVFPTTPQGAISQGESHDPPSPLSTSAAHSEDLPIHTRAPETMPSQLQPAAPSSQVNRSRGNAEQGDRSVTQSSPHPSNSPPDHKPSSASSSDTSSQQPPPATAERFPSRHIASAPGNTATGPASTSNPAWTLQLKRPAQHPSHAPKTPSPRAPTDRDPSHSVASTGSLHAPPSWQALSPAVTVNPSSGPATAPPTTAAAPAPGTAAAATMPGTSRVHDQVDEAGGAPPPPERRKPPRNRFRFTVSKTSDVDLFAPGPVGLPPPPQQQQQQQQQDPGSTRPAPCSTAPYRVHMRLPDDSPPHTVLHVHCSLDGGRTRWSQPLVGCKGSTGQALLTAQLTAPPAHLRRTAVPQADRSGMLLSTRAGKRRSRDEGLGVRAERDVHQQLMVAVSDRPAGPDTGLPAAGEPWCLLAEPGSYWLELSTQQQQGLRRAPEGTAATAPTSPSTPAPAQGTAGVGRQNDGISNHTQACNHDSEGGLVSGSRSDAASTARSTRGVAGRGGMHGGGTCGVFFPVSATRLLQRPSMLVVDLAALCGRRVSRADDEACRRFKAVWSRSLELLPLLLVCSTSRSFASFQQLWIDKQYMLPTPDVLLLCGGTDIMYHTPQGWSVDHTWQQRLRDPRMGWQLSRVQQAVGRLIHSCKQRRQQHKHSLGKTPEQGPETGGPGVGPGPDPEQGPSLGGGPHQAPRLKLDASKQQGPFRVRVLVFGGPQVAGAVAQELEQLLEAEAAALLAEAEQQQQQQQQQHAVRGSEEVRGRGIAWEGRRLRQQDDHPPRAAWQERHLQDGDRPQPGAGDQDTGPGAGWSSGRTPGSGLHPPRRAGATGHGGPRPAPFPMRWRCIVHGHVEGGGGSHQGCAALDVVPCCAGPGPALAHVVGRFQVRPGLLAGCIEAFGDHANLAALCGTMGLGAVTLRSAGQGQGAATRPDLRPRQESADVPDAGLGQASDVPGRPSSTAAAGPCGVLEGLELLGLFRAP